jgi:GrpB-like predicted nucleotidyltransferase (UPF0157 family)
MTFEALRTVYARVLSDHVAAIEHVGSTAVTGLAAKPIIDIDVVIRSRDAITEVVNRLAAVGYRHQGDLGVLSSGDISCFGTGSGPIPDGLPSTAP